MMEHLSKFLRDDRGSTIEFVLWIPLFAVLLLVTVDTAFMYMTMTRMENMARDAARRVSTGEYNTTNIDAFVLANLGGAFYTVDTSCSVAGEGGVACVNISRPVATIVVTGILSSVVGDTFNARVSMRAEPGVRI